MKKIILTFVMAIVAVSCFASLRPATYGSSIMTYYYGGEFYAVMLNDCNHAFIIVDGNELELPRVYSVNVCRQLGIDYK